MPAELAESFGEEFSEKPNEREFDLGAGLLQRVYYKRSELVRIGDILKELLTGITFARFLDQADEIRQVLFYNLRSQDPVDRFEDFVVQSFVMG